MPRFQPAFRDRIILELLLATTLGASVVYLSVTPSWRPGAVLRAHWCREGEVPEFQFGFADLAAQLGPVMGNPTECEHGDDWSSNTLQATTTGVAMYQWCTNTPLFTHGQDHWALTPVGMQHWTGDAGPPRLPPRVRVADMRHPCT